MFGTLDVRGPRDAVPRLCWLESSTRASQLNSWSVR